ncbi:hypothetical protein EJB05_55944, partial [Eragrostis curvula]
MKDSNARRQGRRGSAAGGVQVRGPALPGSAGGVQVRRPSSSDVRRRAAPRLDLRLPSTHPESVPLTVFDKVTIDQHINAMNSLLPPTSPIHRRPGERPREGPHRAACTPPAAARSCSTTPARGSSRRRPMLSSAAPCRWSQRRIQRVAFCPGDAVGMRSLRRGVTRSTTSSPTATPWLPLWSPGARPFAPPPSTLFR